MMVRMLLVLAAMLSTTAAARAEAIATARALFEGAWTRAECNQGLDQALNNTRYHELGDGYSLGMVLCWLGPRSQTFVLFLVAPRTSGRPQLLTLQEWRNKRFETSDVVSMAEYHPDRKAITSYVSYVSYGGTGICGGAGEWTWTGKAFVMTGYWEKSDCNDESEFDRSDRFRIFPPTK